MSERTPIIVTLERKRLEKGWTLYRLRKEAGIPRGTYEGWLKGSNPTTKNLEKVLLALGITITLGQKE